MNAKLKQYFPMIKTREEIRNSIRGDERLESIFQGWTKSQQEEFLDFSSGATGVKMLYDSFFKEIMNPEYYPERMNDLLSVILDMKVKIVHVLPTDSTRLGEETSLVTMDIVVQTEEGSLINVEVQKIGYRFLGERSACYSADLLLRQYKRIKDSYNSKAMFKYKDIKPVYTIVFFEKSPECFKKFPGNVIHRFTQKSDTGLELELLQRFVFVPLDIFREMGKNIDTKVDAWLTFLGSDDVEDILCLIEKYPEFKPMYQTLYEMCMNIEGVMNMFSEELRELDRNTVLFMVDEYQKEVDEKKAEIEELDAKIEEQDAKIQEQEKIIASLRAQLAQQA